MNETESLHNTIQYVTFQLRFGPTNKNTINHVSPHLKTTVSSPRVQTVFRLLIFRSLHSVVAGFHMKC